jgi:hypothetical protein
MSAIDTAAKLRSAALATIDRQCFGEDFGFDATAVVAPAPTGGVMVVYTMIVTKKSPLLGRSPLVNVTQIQSPDPTGEQVEQAITQALSNLRDLSSKILTGDKPAAPHPR